MADSQLGSLLRHIRNLVGAPAADGLTDHQLLERFAAQRDETAFAALVERHGPMVLGVCRRALPNAHDAEDAFQATFLVLARKAGSLRWRESIGPWLYGVASRVTRKARAGAGRRRAHERQAGMLTAADGGSRDGDPLAESSRRELCRLLDEELDRLPSKYRAPLVLCYLQGKTHEEAARELGQPAGSMSRYLARGRELLRERLAQRGVALSAGGLAACLAEEELAAAVPDTLATCTVKTALLFVEGSAVAGALSAEAVALAEGVLQTMTLTKLKLMAALVTMVAVLGTGTGGLLHRAGARPPVQEQKAKPAVQAAPTNVPAAKPKEQHAENTPHESVRAMQRQVSDIRRKLAQPFDLDKGIDANTPLRDTLEFLTEHSGLTFVIDAEAFKADKQIDDPETLPIRMPRMMEIPLSTVLRLILKQAQATYLVRPGYIEVTTLERAWPAMWISPGWDRRHVPTVNISFVNQPLHQALSRLSDQTGINVIVDGRIVEKARKTKVSTALQNVPVDTAVELLADMGDLRAVAIDNVLYVTTKANAARLEAEQQKRQQAGRPAEKQEKPAPATKKPKA